MHPKVLSEAGWAAVRALGRKNLLAGWTLAGGTALALQFGHRRSIDLDLFNADEFDPRSLLKALAKVGKVSVQSQNTSTLHISFNGVRISFLALERPILFPGTPYRELMIADPRDIAVMKLIAIGGRGSRKDFVDLYFILNAIGGLDTIFELLAVRFENLDYSDSHLRKSLVYFEDAEQEPMPHMLREVSWDDVKAAITDEVRRLSS